MSLNLQQIINQDIQDQLVFNLCILNSYFESTFGEHYPKDIINFINNIFLSVLEVRLFCENNNLMLLTSTNEAYVWGCNFYGQLGLGDNKDRTTPHKLLQENIKQVSFGSCHSMILTATERSNEI